VVSADREAPNAAHDGAILDALAVAVLVQTVSGEVVRWNRAAEVVLGMRADELRGRFGPPGDWRFVREDGSDLPPDELPLAMAVSTGHSQSDVVIGIERAGAPMQWLLVLAEPMRDEHGAVVGASATFSDITQRIDGRRRVDAHLRLEQSLRAIARDILQLEGNMLDQSAATTLADIGAQLGLSSIRALVVSDDLIRNPLSWTAAPGPAVADVPAAEVAALESALRPSMAIVHCDGLSAPERDALRRLGINDCGTVFTVRLSNDGLDFGVLLCASDTPRVWHADDVAIVEYVAAMLGAILASRQATDGRRRIEDFLRTVLANSADVVIVMDHESHLSYASPVLERVLGYRVEELLGTPVLELVHPDDLESVIAALGLVLTLEHEDAPAVELRVRHKDGSWVWMECAGYPLMEGDDVAAVVVNARDVQDRRAQRLAMQEMLMRFAEVWERGPTGMALVSMEGVFLDVNPAHCELLGYEREDLVGANVAKVIPPDDLAMLMEAADDVVSGRSERVGAEVRVRRADGQLAWGRVGISVVRDDDGQVLYAVGTLEDVTELRALRGQLEHEATHDALTALPERPLFVELLQSALAAGRRRGVPVAALFIDLDRFKHVNDTLGHAAGDMVLLEYAQRLRDTLRGGDVAGRLGGDEFVVLCTELSDASDVGAVAERVLRVTAEPFEVGGVEVIVGASIGVAVSDGDIDAETMLWQADTAAYRAKALGRDRYEVFDDDLRTQVARRIDTETALRRAIDRDEIIAWYQPIVRGAQAPLYALEGLARWARPGHGLVTPDEFLGVAEDAGLIVALGLHVIDVGCAQLARWQRTSWPDAQVALNVSARQLLHRGFVRALRRRISDAGADPSGLILEITEHSLMEDIDTAVGVLHDIKAMGIRIAIDDFGTGYSSLSQLRHLPVDVLKIDRSFVHALDTDDDAIVASIVQLAHALGMTLVAEGVEHQYQSDALLSMGCELMQGYYFSPPIAPEAVDTLFELRDGAA
jgi:diguanylate cyclase (GGDEF)-like protein/PAS domain S-box-containing protein